jgi:DNA-binding response OmpR family regulator
LRTPLNHLIGYTELILDTLTEEGPADLVPELSRLLALGRDLLDHIAQIIPANYSVRRTDLPVLSSVLLERVEPLLALVGGLLEPPRAGASAVTVADLERVKTAIVLLHDQARHWKRGQVSATSRASGGADREQACSSGTAWGCILVVDNDPGNRDLLGRRLRRQGYTVTDAENGRRALELLASGSFDLVLLEVMMPEMDGYQVLESMKEQPAWRDIPVLVISTMDEIGSVVRCIERGAVDYLPKPFDPVLLRARISACLENRRLRLQELEYLRGVAALESAAAAVEAGSFTPDSLAGVGTRADSLGQLARVFQRMAREVQAREQRLQTEVQHLQIQIDQARKERQVAEITDTEYFAFLHARAGRLKQKFRGGSEEERRDQ